MIDHSVAQMVLDVIVDLLSKILTIEIRYLTKSMCSSIHPSSHNLENPN